MKVIDLLVKIANGEDTPDKFIYDGMLFERHLDNYYQHYDIGKTCSNIVQFTDEICSDYSNLNDEIEIIEDTPKIQVEMTQEEYNKYLDEKIGTSKEDKKIEKIQLSEIYGVNYNDAKYIFASRINEIIDKVKGR